jgi:hypothetical protein
MKLLRSLKRPEKTTYARDCYNDSLVWWRPRGSATVTRGMPLSTDKPSKWQKTHLLTPLSPNHGRFSKTNLLTTVYSGAEERGEERIEFSCLPF